MLKQNKLIFLMGILTMGVLLFGCTPLSPSSSAGEYYTFTDDLGNTVNLEKKPQNVIAAMGSYGELWQLSGGTISAITEDAVSERNMELPSDVKIIGTVKEPNVEMILAENPEFVLLSADVEQHRQISQTLTGAGIPHGYFKIDTFDDYLRMLKISTEINQSPKNYETYGTEIEERIQSSIKNAKQKEKPTVLLIRSMSTKAKALKEDHLTGKILADLNTENIATKHESLLEDLSMETIIQENPDYIFVVPMGDTKKAMETIENTLMKNSAWNTLKAVTGENFHVLPKDLFQYKPNARWAESYEYLEKILYED